MAFVGEKYYFNGKQVKKHVLEKYIKWEQVLSAIKNGSDTSEMLKERLGKGAKDMLCAIKADGMCVADNKTRNATYKVSPKGEELIKNVKQYKKEKKNEEV